MSDLITPYLIGLRSSNVEERFSSARMVAQIVERATLPVGELTALGNHLISVALRERNHDVLEAVLNALSSTAHRSSCLPLEYGQLASLVPTLAGELLAHAMSTLVCARDPLFLDLFRQHVGDPHESVRQEAEAGIQILNAS